MAKVKSPLMSLDASGKIAKSLVFMKWKGINDVRQYVIPANPKSAGQVTQRGHMSQAVQQWHSQPLNTLDHAAFNILASLEAKPMSGFNVFCKKEIGSDILGRTQNEISGFTISGNAGGTIDFTVDAATAETLKFRYGGSASVMGNVVDLTAGSTPPADYVGQITGAVSGSYVYIQVFTETADVDVMSGIYKVLVA